MRFPSRFGLAAAAAAAAVTGSASTGCVYRTPKAHLPASLPSVAASELCIAGITVEDAEGPLDPQKEAAVQGEAGSILTKAIQSRGGEAGPGRVSAHVRLGVTGSIDDSVRKDGIAAMAYLYAPFGLVIERQEVDVDVTLQTRGRSFTGHGHADRLGSIYAHARRRALAVALDRALADASTKSGMGGL